jgi:lipoyl(octanoyl) transferase
MEISNLFQVEKCGRMSYTDALAKQEILFNKILDNKKNKITENLNTLMLVEHNPVYTLGKSGDLSNLKRKPEEVGAEFYKTNRGGDITYHGPGQITGYPIFDLEIFGIGLAKYIWNVEEVMIKTIAEFGLVGTRIDDASGVWLDADTADVRKICALGVKASRYVTMHGFAFNVNTDLTFFDHMIPCGIDDKGVTSLAKETGKPQDFDEIQNLVASKFSEVFGS